MIRAVFASFAAAALVLALSLAACDETGGTGGSGGSSGQGGHGGCPNDPQALFTLTLRAKAGPLPLDTRLKVTWSAGPEPDLVLGDPSTYKTIDEANVVCQLDPGAPPPEDLAELVCKLWTSGATRIEVTATGYAPHDQTYTPMQSDRCEGPVPSEIAIELTADVDAGS